VGGVGGVGWGGGGGRGGELEARRVLEDLAVDGRTGTSGELL